ncbi:hypothetical protein E2C01_068772 [Portunus trituberculatus]|uniref:Uncharacterized protein n=1 Tax=Portunus trituberculatus TaxID=210409 RepID=A0A5B7I109_PORTR|nr:hypothetical protein [Portunus trituberculatus]
MGEHVHMSVFHAHPENGLPSYSDLEELEPRRARYSPSPTNEPLIIQSLSFLLLLPIFFIQLIYKTVIFRSPPPPPPPPSPPPPPPPPPSSASVSGGVTLSAAIIKTFTAAHPSPLMSQRVPDTL